MLSTKRAAENSIASSITGIFLLSFEYYLIRINYLPIDILRWMIYPTIISIGTISTYYAATSLLVLGDEDDPLYDPWSEIT
jgi:hypothetical protein